VTFLYGPSEYSTKHWQRSYSIAGDSLDKPMIKVVDPSLLKDLVKAHFLATR
jgi:hypothetical protein